jgi:polysaccharide pyruvyl transferase WcaK-like protein
MDMYKRDAPLYSIISQAAKKAGCKTIIYGVSAGPISTQLGKFLIKRMYQQADAVSVRDEQSRNVLLKIGVRETIKVISAPVFSLQIKRLNSKIDKPKNIGVTDVPYFSRDYWPTHDENKYQAYIKGMAPNLDEILTYEAEIKMHFFSTNFPQDVMVTKEIYHHMVNKKQVEIIESQL